MFKSGPRPNGATVVKRENMGIVAHLYDLKSSSQRTIDLPGRPRVGA
jgi:hypothetical protein